MYWLHHKEGYSLKNYIMVQSIYNLYWATKCTEP